LDAEIGTEIEFVLLNVAAYQLCFLFLLKLGRASARLFSCREGFGADTETGKRRLYTLGLQRLRHSDQVDGDLGDLICREG